MPDRKCGFVDVPSTTQPGHGSGASDVDTDGEWRRLASPSAESASAKSGSSYALERYWSASSRIEGRKRWSVGVRKIECGCFGVDRERLGGLTSTSIPTGAGFACVIQWSSMAGQEPLPTSQQAAAGIYRREKKSRLRVLTLLGRSPEWLTLARLSQTRGLAAGGCRGSSSFRDSD